GLQGGPRPVRRQLHRHGVQRAEADRAGLRVRAGDEEARAAAAVPVSAEAAEKAEAAGALRPPWAVTSAVQQLHCFRAVLRQQVAQRAAGLVVERVAERRLADPIDAEVAERGAHLAPRGERPGPAPEEDAERAHRPLRCVATLVRVAEARPPA